MKVWELTEGDVWPRGCLRVHTISHSKLTWQTVPEEPYTRLTHTVPGCETSSYVLPIHVSFQPYQLAISFYPWEGKKEGEWKRRERPEQLYIA